MQDLILYLSMSIQTKRHIIFLTAIILSIFLVSFLYYFLFETYDGKTFLDWYVILRPIILLIVPAFITAFFISSIIAGKFNSYYFILFSIWTNLAALIFAIFYIFRCLKYI